MRTKAPINNRKKLYENRSKCSEKNRKNYVKTDAPKNNRKQIYENRCSEKQHKKKYMRQMLR